MFLPETRPEGFGHELPIWTKLIAPDVTPAQAAAGRIFEFPLPWEGGRQPMNVGNRIIVGDLHDAVVDAAAQITVDRLGLASSSPLTKVHH